MASAAVDVAIVVMLLAVPFRNWAAYESKHRLAWFGGVAVAALAIFGRLGGDPRQTFLATTIQFCLLFFVAPVLLAIGSPGKASPNRAVALVGPILACVVTLVWFLTPWLGFELSHDFVYQAGHLALLVAGLVFCVPAIRSQGLDAAAYPILMLVAFMELLLDAVPGILVTIRTNLLAPAVFLTHHTPLAAHTSQLHGGEVLWVIAEVLDIPFLALLVYAWVRADARHAAVIDARLDAHLPPPTEDDAGELQRPWWETDASVFGSRAKTYKSED